MVAWENVCWSKANGGLGFREVLNWNIACLGKYIWAISAKQDNVWIRWIHSVYIKGEDWWSYTPNSRASWYRKRLCAVKEQLKTLFTENELSTMPAYSIQRVYDELQGDKPAVRWDKVIWSRLNIPKHRFVAWLAIQAKLQTTEKLAVIGISQTNKCLMCDDEVDTQSFVFSMYI